MKGHPFKLREIAEEIKEIIQSNIAYRELGAFGVEWKNTVVAGRIKDRKEQMRKVTKN